MFEYTGEIIYEVYFMLRVNVSWSCAEMGETPVPESVLKKQKRSEEWALAKKQELESAKKKNAENRKLIYNRAKLYAKEYAEQVLLNSVFFG